MIRLAVKTAAALGLHATGADRLIGALGGRGRPPLVLCYHRVVEDVGRHPWSAPAMLVSRRTLERQLDWIGRRVEFVGLDELARGLEEDGGSFDRPIAAVTFDDGYADVYHHALPLLSAKGIPAAFFVVTDLLGTERLHAHDELYALLCGAAERLGDAGLAGLLTRVGLGALWLRHPHEGPVSTRFAVLTERLLRSLPRHRVRRLLRRLRRVAAVPEKVRDELRPMSWEMVADLRAAGMTIGSHTRSHRVLPNEPAGEVLLELVGSKQALEERLGAAVDHLSYPDGQFGPGAVAAAQGAGYRYAYTTCGHRSAERPLLTIPRRTFWERTTAGLGGDFSPAVTACQVEGVFQRLRPCRCDHGPRRRRLPEPPAIGPFRFSGGTT